MNDFFANDYIVGFFVSLRYLPPTKPHEGGGMVLTKAFTEAADGKTCFFSEDALSRQREKPCPVNMVAFEKEIFGLVRVADLQEGLVELKEESKFCGLLAVSELSWFNRLTSNWCSAHPDDAIPFENRVEAFKSWPRPMPLSRAGAITDYTTRSLYSGPRLIRQFLDYLDNLSQPTAPSA